MKQDPSIGDPLDTGTWKDIKQEPATPDMIQSSPVTGMHWFILLAIATYWAALMWCCELWTSIFLHKSMSFCHRIASVSQIVIRYLFFIYDSYELLKIEGKKCVPYLLCYIIREICFKNLQCVYLSHISLKNKLFLIFHSAGFGNLFGPTFI